MSEFLKSEVFSWIKTIVFAVVLAGMLMAELFAVSLSTVLLILCGGILGICCYGIWQRKGAEK